jgi:CBS domain-containing protein
MVPSSNPIQDRVAEFLQRYPPFSLLEPADRAELAARVSIRYVTAGTVLFREGTPPGDEFYVVRQGSVEVYEEGPPRQLVDVCDEGDVFGVRAHVAREPYLATAEAVDECLLYVVPVAAAQPFLRKSARVALYFAAAFASGRPHQRRRAGSSLAGGRMPREGPVSVPFLNDTLVLNATKEVLTCAATETIRDAAVAMTGHGYGSIVIVDGAGAPVGILTDRDLRSKVVTGRHSADEPVSAIMSRPVKTVRAGITLAEAMIEMVRQKVHHLCVTADGTDGSEVTGLVSDHDLLLVQGFNPAIMIKEARKTTSLPQLAAIREKAEELLSRYLEQDAGALYVSSTVSAVTDAIVQRLVDLHLASEGAPPRGFAWLALGSLGREEQLLRTDQDHALVYEGEPDEAAAAWFRRLGAFVSDGLSACGFAPDPGGVSASSPEWCRSLPEWKQTLRRWVERPDDHDLLLATVFLDFRPVAGEPALARELTRFLHEEIARTEIFLARMAENALSTPPPLSFFRSFMVERNGEHRNEFDLKVRAMIPLADAARLLSLDHGLAGENGTIRRYQRLAALETGHRELYEEAAHAYEILLKTRARFGLKNRNAGRFIDPGALDKLERQTLRNIFAAVKELQDVLKVRFPAGRLR